MLRYIAWLYVKDDSLRGAQICFVTGPRIELSITLIDRLKRLFEEKIQFDIKETVIELDGVHIEAYSSHHRWITGRLLEKIERESEETCLCKRLFFDYTLKQHFCR
jgi:hypothetical protein